MSFAAWVRLFDTVSGLAQVSRRFRGAQAEESPDRPFEGTQPPGQLEARLAGVVVAALKEAFDRDRTRLDLERAELDAQRARAEEALRLELVRQAGERALGQVRAVGFIAVLVWVTSAVLAVWVPGLRDALPRILLGGGWLALIGTLGAAVVGYQELTRWLVEASGPRAAAVPAPPAGRAAAVAPWLLLAGLALTAVSLIISL